MRRRRIHRRRGTATAQVARVAATTPGGATGGTERRGNCSRASPTPPKIPLRARCHGGGAAGRRCRPIQQPWRPGEVAALVVRVDASTAARTREELWPRCCWWAVGAPPPEPSAARGGGGVVGARRRRTWHGDGRHDAAVAMVVVPVTTTDPRSAGKGQQRRWWCVSPPTRMKPLAARGGGGAGEACPTTGARRRRTARNHRS